MATYPASKKTFSQIVDGVTYMQGVNVNTAYNEVEAIMTFLGSLGSGNTQGYAAALLSTLSNYRMGALISYSDANTISISAGGIVFTGDSGKFRLRYNSSAVTANWSDLDTGSEANTTYYVWATADNEETTFDIKISASASAPSGQTYYRLLGGFTNNSDIQQETVHNKDGISPGSNISILTGTVTGGGTIPLPDGYVQAQCKWTVGLGYIRFQDDQHATDFWFQASVNASRVVTVTYRASYGGGYQSANTGSYANYIIIGIK